MPVVFANVLQPLIDVCDVVLVYFHGLLGSWGMAIIALTLLVRACLAAGAWFSRRLPAIRKLVRPIYIERGIIPAPVPAPEPEAGAA